MNSMQAVVPSQRLVEQITSFESYSQKAYICPGGAVTYGIGSTMKADGTPVKMGDEITREEAVELLKRDLVDLIVQVRSAITWDAPENVVDACVSLAYNIGIGAFRDSTCLKRLNSGDIAGASTALQWFNKATDPSTGKKRVLGGLTARRQVEADLMLNGWDGTSSAVVTGGTIAENKPTMVKSTTVWGILLAGGTYVATTILPMLPQLLPGVWSQSQAISGQLGAASGTQDFLMQAVGIALGLGMALWAKRRDLRKGSPFGSQGR